MLQKEESSLTPWPYQKTVKEQEMLQENNISLEPKPFAIGLRVQHPQDMINKNQYGSQNGSI